MQITKLGEFGLIELFKKNLKLDNSVVKGPGDDCAVIKLDAGNYLLFTCDMLIEGVDFLPRHSPYLVGRKAIAVSVSDIAACGGVPRYCLVSLGLKKNTSVKFVSALFKGMQALAQKYKINLVGGDISRAERLTIDVSMLGKVEKKRLVLRQGAKVGDIIFTTGALGGSIKGKHLKFTPRLKEARFLVERFLINSMMDISDGLTQDLFHILKESKVGAVLYEELIPISPQAKGMNDALYSGEDFELLFTAAAGEARKIMRQKNKKFIPIGEITGHKGELVLMDRRGKERKISPGGFRHF